MPINRLIREESSALSAVITCTPFLTAVFTVGALRVRSIAESTITSAPFSAAREIILFCAA